MSNSHTHIPVFNFKQFVIRFLFLFAVFYGGFQCWIALTSPGGLYSSWVHHYFDGITLWRNVLLWSSKQTLAIAGMETEYRSDYVLASPGGGGIKLVYSCLAFGVMSFWAAYILAMQAGGRRKILWLAGGLAGIYVINVLRLSLVLWYLNHQASFPWFDHHTWFNIAAYIFIFGMTWLHYKQTQPNKPAKRQ
ncbi:MAG: exosortase/archaeosortase family protein [Ferruginibacter sp.]